MDGDDFDCGIVQGSDVVVYAEDGGDCIGREVWHIDRVVCVALDCCVGECETEATVPVMCDSCKGNCTCGSGGVLGLSSGITTVVGCRCCRILFTLAC